MGGIAHLTPHVTLSRLLAMNQPQVRKRESKLGSPRSDELRLLLHEVDAGHGK